MPNKHNPHVNHIPLLPKIKSDRETEMVVNVNLPTPAEPAKTFKAVIIDDREVKLVIVP